MRDGKEPPSVRGREKEGERCLDHRYVPGETRRHPCGGSPSPCLLSAVFQQLYNVADSVVAGRFVGEDALAAVGASFPITMIFMAVALGSNTGCSVIISQLFGAKETARMKTAVSTSVIAILALSALLTAGGFLFCEPLMRLLSTPENVFADSQLYLNVYIGGLTFLFLYNICTGVFTALGDSRTPLYFLIASSLANIVMDVVFVVCFHMGVGGVAWATFLCQGVASVLAAWTLFRRLRGVPAPGAASAVFLADAGRIARIAVPSIYSRALSPWATCSSRALSTALAPLWWPVIPRR